MPSTATTPTQVGAPRSIPSAATTRRSVSPPTLALPAFAIVIWLFATLGLGGHLGRSTDDYSFNLADPVTGPPPLARFDPWTDKESFWRPVHQVMLFAVRTYFDEYDRGIHIGVAIMHGLACLLLYRVLAAAIGSRGVPAAASLLFLVLPIHHEVAFWFCTTSTAIGTALLLWLCIAMVRWSRTAPSLRSWSSVAPMCVIALAIPFFYEQPGAAVAAIPLLYLATCSPEQTLRQRLVRALGSTFFIGLTQLAFAAAMILTADTNERGSVGSMIHAADVPSRAAQLGRMLRDQTWGAAAQQTIAGSWILGTRAVTSTIAWVWLVIAGLAAAAWILTTARRTESADSRIARPVWRWYFLVLFGVVIALLSLLPVAVIKNQIVSPRMMYVPLLGVFISLAAVVGRLSMLTAGLSQTGIVRGLSAAVVATAVVAASVCLLGLQRVYQRSADLDQKVIERLAALAPDPPTNTVYVPVWILARPTGTGMALFDNLRPGVFETSWSAAPPVRRALHRRDVYVSSRNPWIGAELHHPTAESVLLPTTSLSSAVFKNQVGHSVAVPWRNIVPFVVGHNGDVRLVKRIVFDAEDGTQLSVDPPIVADLVRSGSLEDRALAEARLDGGWDPGDMRPLEGWTWRDHTPIGSPITLHPWRETSRPRNAVWMHPTADKGRRAAMSVTIAPSESPRRVVLHATVVEYDMKRSPRSTPIELAVSLGDNSPTIIKLDRPTVRAARRWFMVAMDVPPSTSPTVLSALVRPQPSAEGQPAERADPCWVSIGQIGPVPKALEHPAESGTRRE